MRRRGFDGLDRGGEQAPDRGEIGGRRPSRVDGGFAHFGEQCRHRLALVAGELTASEVAGLDAVGALVDRRDPRVAQMLGRTRLLDVAHAAMHLDAGRGDRDAHIGAPGLDHRDQQIGAALVTLAPGRIGVAPAAVEQRRGIIGQRPHRLGRGAHRQQHAPHIGVVDDRQCAAIGRRRSTERPALHPGAGEVAGLLIGALGDRHTLEPDIEPGVVHHREHVFEAALLLADAPADRVFIGEHAGRRGVDAELLFEAQGAHRVARPRPALVVGQEFRHQEQ